MYWPCAARPAARTTIKRNAVEERLLIIRTLDRQRRRARHSHLSAMKARVTIRVCWLDIWYGCQGEPSGCRVWPALRRAGHTYLRVRPHNVRSELTNECFFLPHRSSDLLRVSKGSPRRVCSAHSFSGRSNSKSTYRMNTQDKPKTFRGARQS